MKRSTKILIIAFFSTALILYGIIYLVPKVKGMATKTTLLEYGDMPVDDEKDIYFIRTETLYLADSSGEVTKLVKEGTKVRQGIEIVDIKDAPPKASTSAVSSEEAVQGEEDDASYYKKYDNLLRNTRGAAKVSTDNTAEFSAVVSYYADGFEGSVTPETIDKLTLSKAKSLPAEATPLDRDPVRAGDPVFKLTDNNLWYMVFWLEESSKKGDIDKYEENKTVTVDFGSTKIEAVTEKLIEEGNDWKIVLRSDVYYKDLPKYRKKKAKVISEEIRGLILKTMSITVHDGQPGVFVKQLSGNFKWVPVEIGKSIGDKCTVAVGKFTDKKSGKQVVTVNYYDEILTDPKAEGYE